MSVSVPSDFLYSHLLAMVALGGLPVRRCIPLSNPSITSGYSKLSDGIYLPGSKNFYQCQEVMAMLAEID